MKIIQITPEFPPNCGGIGYYVFYLSRELIRMGHDVSVICRSNENKDYSYQQIPVKKIKVKLPAPFNLSVFRRKVNKILVEKTMDMIHIHSTVLTMPSCTCPVMVTAHMCNSEGIRKYHRPIVDFDSLYRNIMLPIYSGIESKIARSCDKLTVISDSQQKEFQKHYHICSDVIYNGVDTDFFKPTPEIDKEDAIIFIGKFGAGKGVLDLLEIADMLKKDRPQTKLYMIGNGPLKNRLKQEIKKRGLSNISMINQIEHSELINYYRRTKIFVLPTYYEGLPTTLLEAMACELPVVTTNISGIPALIDNQIDGFMLNPGDIQGFNRRIVELLDSSEKRIITGKNARRKVCEKFTWSIIATNIACKYKNLIRQKMGSL